MFPDFWTKVLPTVCKDMKGKERDTHINILWRELLQENPKPRPVGDLVGVQAREPQAQNFRILRRQQEMSGTGFPSFPLSNLEHHPAPPFICMITRTADPLLHLWSD